jgi:phosphoglycerate dehydrogenase-like enzyme
MLLACARRLFEGDREVRAGVWNPLYLMSVGRLRGQVLGRVGFGKIGQAVARRATAFGLSVIYFDPARQDARTSTQATACKDLHKLLLQADFVSLHVPLTKETAWHAGHAAISPDEAHKHSHFRPPPKSFLDAGSKALRNAFRAKQTWRIIVRHRV